jgi:hypothetical protein
VRACVRARVCVCVCVCLVSAEIPRTKATKKHAWEVLREWGSKCKTYLQLQNNHHSFQLLPQARM